MDFDMLSKLQTWKTGFNDMEWPRFDLSKIRWSRMPELRIGDSIAKLPIVQGGMGVGISGAGLASAVANEGGIGVISAVGLGLKLIAAPLVALFCCSLFGWQGFAAKVSVFEAGMPPMVTAAALASLAGLAPEFTAAMVGYGILFSFATLPMLFQFL